MKQMFDKREVSKASLNMDGLRVKTYGIKELEELKEKNIHGQCLVNCEDYDVICIRILHEEKIDGKDLDYDIIMNKNKILVLYNDCETKTQNCMISITYYDNKENFISYNISGFPKEVMNNVISSWGTPPGFVVRFKDFDSATIPMSDYITLHYMALIKPIEIEFNSKENIKYKEYIYNVTLYGDCDNI